MLQQRRVAPVPKVYGIRGLRVVWRLSLWGMLALVGALVLAVLWAAAPSSPNTEIVSAAAFWAISAGVVGASLNAMQLAAESVFRVGLVHLSNGMNGSLRIVVVMTGVVVAAAVPSLTVANEPPAAARPFAVGLIVLFAADLLLMATLAAYTRYLIRLRAGHLSAQRRRLRAASKRTRSGSLRRIEAGLDAEESCGPMHVASRGVSFPGLTGRPFHDDMCLSWMRRLEAHFEDVQLELLALVATPESTRQHYPGNRRWKSLTLRGASGSISSALANAPVTASILEEVGGGGEALISVMEPGARIDTHIDFSSPRLTYHLPLTIPPGCGIRVGPEVRQWQEGHGLVLDTSYEHEAWNDSDAPRAILLIDFLHPELEPEEREFFERTDGEAA